MDELHSDSSSIADSFDIHQAEAHESNSEEMPDLVAEENAIINQVQVFRSTNQTPIQPIQLFTNDFDNVVYPTIWHTTSQIATCKHCNHTDDTKTRPRIGLGTVLLSCFLGIAGCCCCVPFICSCLKDVEHLCRKCGKTVGYRNFL